MNDAPILICYDGSEPSRRAIRVAAAILGPRPAVVLDVAPCSPPRRAMPSQLRQRLPQSSSTRTRMRR